MALNLGLGFVFGAKDTGLGKQLEGLTCQLAAMSESLNQVAAKAAGTAAPLDNIVQPSQIKTMTSMTEAAEDLGETTGKTLPERTRRGSESFWRSSRRIDTSQRMISSGFDLMKDGVEKLNSILSINKLQTFLQAINLGHVQDIAEKLGDVSAGGGQLTTSFEATIVAAGKTTKAFGANAGIVGRDLKRFTSKATGMSIGLNISADAAAKALYEYGQAPKELAAMGLASANDMAKFTEVFGVQGNVLGDAGRVMRKQFKMTDEQIKAVTSSFASSGQALGDVGAAFNEMPKVMEQLQRRASSLGEALDPGQLAQYATGTEALAAGFFQMGNSTEKARELAMQLSDTLIASREDYAGMFAGTKGDLNAFSTALGIASGNIQNSYDAMKQGPDQFMTSMAQMVQASKKAGKFNGASMNLIREQMSSVFGPQQAAQMMDFFTNADEKTLDIMASTKKATKSLGQMGREGFSTGRTLADQFELAKDSFISSFRGIGRSAAVDFVAKTSAEFKVFTKKLKGIAAEGGPLGMVVTKFSEMHQIGALALLPQTLRPMAAVFGTMAKEAAPLIGVLGSMGLRFSHLFNPITLVAGALVAWLAVSKMAEDQGLKEAHVFTKDAKAQKKHAEAWKALTEEQGKYNKGSAEWNALEAKKGAMDAKWNRAFQYKKEADALAGLEKQRKKAGKGADTKGLDAQIKAKQAEMVAIDKAIAAQARKEGQAAMVAGIKGVLQKAVAIIQTLPRMLAEIWPELKLAWKEISPALLEAFTLAFNWVEKTVWPATVQFLRGLWDGIVSGSKATQGSASTKVGSAIGATLRGAFDYALVVVKNYIKGWWVKMGAIWSDPSKSFKDKITETASGSAGLILAAFAVAKFTPIFKVLGMFGNIAGSVGSLVIGVFGKLYQVVSSLIRAYQFLAPWIEFLAYGFTGVELAIGGVIAVVVALTAGFLFFPKATQKIVDKVGQVLEGAFAWLTTFLLDVSATILKYTIGILWQIPKVIPKLYVAIGKALTGVVGWIQSALNGALKGIENWLVKKFPAQAGAIQKVFGAIRQGVAAAFGTVRFYINYAVEAVKLLVKSFVIVAKVAWAMLQPIIMPIKLITKLIIKGVVWAFEKVAGVVTVVKSKVLEAFTAVKAFVAPIISWVEGLVATVQKALGDLMAAADRAWNYVAGKAEQAAGWIGDKVGDIADRAASLVPDVLKGADRPLMEAFKGFEAQTTQWTEAQKKAFRDTLTQVSATAVSILEASGIPELARGLGAPFITTAEEAAKATAVAAAATKANNELAGLSYATLADDASRNLQWVNAQAALFSAKTLANVGSVDARIQEEARGAAEALNASFLESMLAINRRTDIDAATKAKLMADARSNNEKAAADLNAALAQQSRELNTVTSTNVDAVKANIGQARDAALEASTATTEALAGQAGEFQTRLGLDAQQATDVLTRIIDMNPKTFQTKTNRILGIYTTFLTQAQAKTQELIPATEKAFDTFQMVVETYWANMAAQMVVFAFGALAGVTQVVKSGIESAVTTVFAAVGELAAAVVSGMLLKGVTAGLKKVTEATKKWKEDELAVFREMAAAIVKALDDAWSKASQSASTTADEITKNVRAISAALATASNGLKVSAAVKTDVQNTGTLAVVPQSIKDLKGDDLQQQIYTATNYPAWWTQYQALFMSQMSALTAATLANKPQGGRKAAAK